MASIAGLHGSSQVVLEGSGSTRLNVGSGSRVTRAGLAARAQSSRRPVLSLVAAGLPTASSVQTDAKPPPSSARLPGTLNSDEARDLKLPLKERFPLYRQTLTK
uniref:Uncharacterized protein n=1 Tax=Cajanus cajan TaxID=3821 RepID=A0A151RLZ8_CAJCA|nr:hypothetical protein KK1_034969 [Cajanus cajan]